MFKTVGVKSLDDLFDAIPSILMKKKKMLVWPSKPIWVYPEAI